MFLDFATLSPADRYKVLVNTITPRPIAWTVTKGRDGSVNAAPHSFFNALGDEPPLIVLGLLAHHARGDDKDTARLIRETGEFIVALVSEADAEAMNLTAADAPPGVDELAAAWVATRPATKISPPLIASAPVNFECKVWQIIDPSPRSTIVLGEIVAAHIADAYVQDAAKLRFDTQAMQLIGRQHGGGNYVRNADSFEMKRVGWPLPGKDAV
ncbi:flavin reductase family protein [Novosphingobium sp.]|uniref:flavin reductase family protein n=1 Tax=Novosphingobium sp. TaxID=1874826 RepID=UPI0035AF0241